jgi:hypothetical protein
MRSSFLLLCSSISRNAVVDVLMITSKWVRGTDFNGECPGLLRMNSHSLREAGEQKKPEVFLCDSLTRRPIPHF